MDTGQNEPRRNAEERGFSGEATMVPPIRYDTTPTWRRIGELCLLNVGWFAFGASASLLAYAWAMQLVVQFIPVPTFGCHMLLLVSPSLTGIAAACLVWRLSPVRGWLETYSLTNGVWAFLLGWNIFAHGFFGSIFVWNVIVLSGEL